MAPVKYEMSILAQQHQQPHHQLIVVRIITGAGKLAN